MSREILVIIGLEFQKVNKKRVKELLKELLEEEDNYNIKNEDNDGMDVRLDVYTHLQLEEEDFDELKEVCYYINKSEYEFVDDGCFIWEKEEESCIKCGKIINLDESDEYGGKCRTCNNERSGEMGKCPRCDGKMRIKDYQEDCSNNDGKMPCPDCEGNGVVEK